MKVIPEWKRVLRHAWSVRLAAISGLLSGAELVLPMFSDAIHRGTFAALAVVLAIAAGIARFVVQEKIRGTD